VRALLSVSDKRGLVAFARGLTTLGWEIVSTGGTAEALRREGIAVTPIESVTGFPEMMDGRLKTLHPKVHGGLLARRQHPGDVAAMAAHGITPIDLVAVNLYPFQETIRRPGVTLPQAIEQIDIGGPTMLRSAAKNHEAVIVLVDPEDYGSVLTDLQADGPSPERRRALAAKVFAHTAAYDAVITGFLSGHTDEPLPARLALVLDRAQARVREPTSALYAQRAGLRDCSSCTELSFNNLLTSMRP
jgi:phosphoribosylaminoimidazolecarboxamide formyltransferase/IMP cyclohydrolase